MLYFISHILGKTKQPTGTGHVEIRVTVMRRFNHWCKTCHDFHHRAHGPAVQWLIGRNYRNIPALPDPHTGILDESGHPLPSDFGSETVRIDEIVDSLPQEVQLRRGRCPYCKRPIWRMGTNSFACNNCGRLIQAQISNRNDQAASPETAQ